MGYNSDGAAAAAAEKRWNDTQDRPGDGARLDGGVDSEGAAGRAGK